MTIKSRPYSGEQDYQRVRDLLVESYDITGKLHNWGLDRWDVFRYSAHASDEIAGRRPWEADVRLWERDSGQLVGAVHPEDGGDVFLQIHPHYRHLEDEMLEWAERRHQDSRPSEADRWPLNTYVYDYDAERAALLARRGYENRGHCGYTRRRSLDGPIPDARLPQGYLVRNARSEDKDDREKLVAVSNAAFSSNRATAEIIRVLAGAPTYRPDLDLVVVAPDGTFGSFCIVWFSETNRIAVFEPVGTHPAHQRRGLAKAMMCEGLRRIEALGVATVYVGAGTGAAANRLYESVGFTDFDRDYLWRKEF